MTIFRLECPPEDNNIRIVHAVTYHGSVAEIDIHMYEKGQDGHMKYVGKMMRAANVVPKNPESNFLFKGFDAS